MLGYIGRRIWSQFSKSFILISSSSQPYFETYCYSRSFMSVSSVYKNKLRIRTNHKVVEQPMISIRFEFIVLKVQELTCPEFSCILRKDLRPTILLRSTADIIFEEFRFVEQITHAFPSSS